MQCHIGVNHDEVRLRDQSAVTDVWHIQYGLLTLTLSAPFIPAPHIISQVVLTDNLRISCRMAGSADFRNSCKVPAVTATWGNLFHNRIVLGNMLYTGITVYRSAHVTVCLLAREDSSKAAQAAARRHPEFKTG
ncbi:hypothetical protein E2C01_008327 [Portunus trituberculatus]|uniref:Uncharacterized protein n=1 Tax=Portunus trituberculatus TaxID=210409 RepID=A0A5B7D3N3_PORTR|nr:hypothetical protein [Portunus trituberculatus]